MKSFIAVFNFDGTLIKGDSTLIFLFLLRGPFYLIMDFIGISHLLVLCFFGKKNQLYIKEKLINKALQSTSDLKIKEVLYIKLPLILKKNIREDAIERLNWHKNQGHRCVIISSSPKPLISDISALLNIELIASECNDMELINSKNKFLINNIESKGPDKLSRLIDYLGYLPKPKYLEVYGNNKGDKELLNSSKFPHYRTFKSQPKEYRDSNAVNYLITILAIAILIFGLNKLLAIDLSESIILKNSIKKLIYWLPLFYLILFFSYLFRYLRWKILLDSFSIEGWNFHDALIWFQGFALTATPGKIGEISRVYLLNKHLDYPKDILLLIFFLERFLDLISVLIWFIIISPNIFFNKTQEFFNFYHFGIIIILSFFIFLLFLKKYFLNFKGLWKIIYKLNNKLVFLINSIKALLVSIIFWALEASILWLLVFVIAPNPILIKKAIYIYFISGLAGVLSGLPGGIGINEATSSILLQQEGVPSLLAISISILRRLITIWSVSLLSISSSFFNKK